MNCFDGKVRFFIIKMKPPMYLVLTFTKCLIFLISAEIQQVAGQNKIVGGHEAKPHSHPYIVSLQTRLLYMRMHVCGGALINKYFILSAAHCASESWLIRWLPMDAVAGMHNVNVFKSPVQVNQIKERIPHPLYNGGIGPHDIALFKTMLPFKFTKAVKPIKLPSNFINEPGASTLKVIGWGALSTTFFFPDLPDNLQEVKVKAIPFRDCYNLIEALKEIYESNPLDKQSNLCTGPTSGGVAACAGDSGGPLVQIRNIVSPTPNPVEENPEIHNASFYNKEQGRLEEGKPQADNDKSVLLGVVSWGVSPCGEVGAPTVYTNVSNYIDFIEYAIKI